MSRGFIFQKKLQALNIVMNNSEWKQNEHRILAFVVCSPKFPKITLSENCESCEILLAEFFSGNFFYPQQFLPSISAKYAIITQTLCQCLDQTRHV